MITQLLKLVSRHEFGGLSNRHHKGRKLRKMTRWSQFVAMTLAQLSGSARLRDVVNNLADQVSKLYHLDTALVSRSSLARVNEQQPYTLYEQLAGKLLAHCQVRAPRHGFRFRNKLCSLDTSTIDLCISIFPWAWFRATKGVVKPHVGLDHDGMLPSFDQTIQLTGPKAVHCPIALRRIGVEDAETGKQPYYLINIFELAAATIAEIYKARCQIELFFKWIRQNLKIKSFLGTYRKTMMTQICIAICVYLLLTYLRFTSLIDSSLQQFLRFIQLNLFERRGLRGLPAEAPPETPTLQLQTTLSFS